MTFIYLPLHNKMMSSISKSTLDSQRFKTPMVKKDNQTLLPFKTFIVHLEGYSIPEMISPIWLMLTDIYVPIGRVYP